MADTQKITTPEKSGPTENPANAGPENDVDTNVSKKNTYIVLDVVLYRVVDEKTGRARRYNQGQEVELTENEAKNLLQAPRPSIIEKEAVEDNEEK